MKRMTVALILVVVGTLVVVAPASAATSARPVDGRCGQRDRRVHA